MRPDVATAYAKAVSDGRIVACEHIRNAANRHLSDLQRDDLIWDPTRADDCIDFLTTYCVVVNPETQTKAPIELLPWQAFLIQSLFGWVVKDNDKLRRIAGTRRFRKIFLTSGKSSGKSAMFAGLHLYLLTQDHYIDLEDNYRYIENPEIVIYASKKEQAVDLCLRGIAELVDTNEAIRSRFGCQTVGGNNPSRVICTGNNGFIEALASSKGGRNFKGRKLHVVHSEETSTAHDRESWEYLIANLKVSPQPLLTMATNPPGFMFGIAYEEYRIACEAAKGNPDHDSVLGLVYTTDECDVPRSVVGDRRWYPVEKNWVKGNPSIDDGIPLKAYLRSQINNATTPTKRRTILRENFGVWADTKTGYIDRDRLVECEVDKIKPRNGARCWLGLDLAARDDFTALACVFEDKDKYLMRVLAYTGLATLPERDEESSGTLMDWAAEGLIIGNDEDHLDFNMVVSEIQELVSQYDVQGLAIDPHKKYEFEKAMQEMGLPYHYEKEGRGSGLKVVVHPQGWQKEGGTGLTMHNSMEALEELFYSGRVSFERHKVFQWALQSVVVRSSQDNRRMVNKRDSNTLNRGKIDVLVAAIMAAGLMKRGDFEVEDKDYNPWRDSEFDLLSLQNHFYANLNN